MVHNTHIFPPGVADKEGEEEPGKGKSKHAKGKKVSNGLTSQIVKDVSSINTDHYDLEFEVETRYSLTTTHFFGQFLLILKLADCLFLMVSVSSVGGPIVQKDVCNI